MIVQLLTVQLTVGLPEAPLPQPNEQSGAAIKAKVKIRILEVLIDSALSVDTTCCSFAETVTVYTLRIRKPRFCSVGLKQFFEGLKSQPPCDREVRLACLHI